METSPGPTIPGRTTANRHRSSILCQELFRNSGSGLRVAPFSLCGKRGLRTAWHFDAAVNRSGSSCGMVRAMEVPIWIASRTISGGMSPPRVNSFHQSEYLYALLPLEAISGAEMPSCQTPDTIVVTGSDGIPFSLWVIIAPRVSIAMEPMRSGSSLMPAIS